MQTIHNTSPETLPSYYTPLVKLCEGLLPEYPGYVEHEVPVGGEVVDDETEGLDGLTA